MHLLSRVLPIFLLCLVAAALPAAPAQAECVSWYIELSPESGPPGTEVEVHGYKFEANEPVDIYYDGGLLIEGFETDSKGEFTVTLTVPERCTGHYWVLGRVGSIRGIVEADRLFAVKPGLVVLPEKGPVGSKVTVQGRGFAGNEQDIEFIYYPDGSYQTIERNIVADSKGSWERSFLIPPSTRGEHKLDAQGAESKLYQVQDAIFRVTAEINIDKSSGTVGETIAMTGSKFAVYEDGINILFGGQTVVTDIKADSKGEWEASFQVPQMPTGEYSVTAEGEQTKKEDIQELVFQIEPRIGLSAYEGHLGMDLTITGIGFAADEDVIIMYDDGQVGNATTSGMGGFEATFSVPQSVHGEPKVTAGYSGQNAASSIFTVESDPPPVPALISPSDGSRMGFRGGVTPTFEWSAVSDDSGLHYSLRVSTGENVTASSALISVTNLTETSYTVIEALPLGTYYWTVQAVDGAANEGDWSEVHSFRVGLMPRWAFIAAIVGAVVLLLLLVRALLRRRSIYSDGW